MDETTNQYLSEEYLRNARSPMLPQAGLNTPAFVNFNSPQMGIYAPAVYNTQTPRNYPFYESPAFQAPKFHKRTELLENRAAMDERLVDYQQKLSQQNAEDFYNAEQLQKTSENFVTGGASLDKKGRGLSFSAAQNVNRLLKTTSEDETYQKSVEGAFNHADLLKMTQLSASSGLLQLENNPQAIQQKMIAISKAVKNYMQIIGDPDVTSAIKKLGEFQTMGMTMQQAVMATNQMNMFSRMAGTSYGQVLEQGGRMGGAYYQQNGLTAGLGTVMGAGAMGMAQQAIASGSFTEEQIARLGGVQGMTQRGIEATFNQISNPMFTGALVKNLGGGEFGLDVEAMQQLERGEISAFDMPGRAAKNIGSDIASFQQQLPELQNQIAHAMGPLRLEIARIATIQKTMELTGEKGPEGFSRTAKAILGERDAEELIAKVSNPEYSKDLQRQIDVQIKESNINAAKQVQSYGSIIKETSSVGRAVYETIALRGRESVLRDEYAAATEKAEAETRAQDELATQGFGRVKTIRAPESLKITGNLRRQVSQGYTADDFQRATRQRAYDPNEFYGATTTEAPNLQYHPFTTPFRKAIARRFGTQDERDVIRQSVESIGYEDNAAALLTLGVGIASKFNPSKDLLGETLQNAQTFAEQSNVVNTQLQKAKFSTGAEYSDTHKAIREKHALGEEEYSALRRKVAPLVQKQFDEDKAGIFGKYFGVQKRFSQASIQKLQETPEFKAMTPAQRAAALEMAPTIAGAELVGGVESVATYTRPNEIVSAGVTEKLTGQAARQQAQVDMMRAATSTPFKEYAEGAGYLETGKQAGGALVNALVEQRLPTMKELDEFTSVKGLGKQAEGVAKLIAHPVSKFLDTDNSQKYYEEAMGRLGGGALRSVVPGLPGMVLAASQGEMPGARHPLAIAKDVASAAFYGATSYLKPVAAETAAYFSVMDKTFDSQTDRSKRVGTVVALMEAAATSDKPEDKSAAQKYIDTLKIPEKEKDILKRDADKKRKAIHENATTEERSKLREFGGALLLLNPEEIEGRVTQHVNATRDVRIQDAVTTGLQKLTGEKDAKGIDKFKEKVEWTEGGKKVEGEQISLEKLRMVYTDPTKRAGAPKELQKLLTQYDAAQRIEKTEDRERAVKRLDREMFNLAFTKGGGDETEVRTSMTTPESERLKGLKDIVGRTAAKGSDIFMGSATKLEQAAKTFSDAVDTFQSRDPKNPKGMVNG